MQKTGMITIISGTNRAGNNTIKVAEYYQQLLKNRNVNAQLISMEDVPADILEVSKYSDTKRSREFAALQEKYVIPAEKFIFVVPEYNGSIPGILKLFLDSCDIEEAFYHKKALLAGVSSGRAGNLRGLDHLTNILHYLRMIVHPNKVPISRIYDELNKEGQFIKSQTIREIDEQLEEFLNF